MATQLNPPSAVSLPVLGVTAGERCSVFRPTGDALSLVPPKVGVLRRELMTSFAMGLGGMNISHTTEAMDGSVFSYSHEHQMAGVHAQGLLTSVVKVQTPRDRPMNKLPYPPVGVLRCASRCLKHGSASGGGCRRPHPTRSLVTHVSDIELAPKPLWNKAFRCHDSKPIRLCGAE